MENFFAYFRKTLRELFVNFGIAAAYSNLIYYSTSLSRKWLMEASNLLYAGQSSVYRRKEENNCTSFCLYSAVVANGHDHAVNDESPRGPGLKEVFLTMRFVFDGTDTFERSTFAVSIVLYLIEFGNKKSVEAYFDVSRLFVQADIIRFDVRKAIDRVYRDQKVSFVYADTDETDDELRQRFQDLSRGDPSTSEDERMAEHDEEWSMIVESSSSSSLSDWNDGHRQEETTGGGDRSDGDRFKGQEE
jgi:hypothetical protein